MVVYGTAQVQVCVYVCLFNCTIQCTCTLHTRPVRFLLGLLGSRIREVSDPDYARFFQPFFGQKMNVFSKQKKFCSVRNERHSVSTTWQRKSSRTLRPTYSSRKRTGLVCTVHCAVCSVHVCTVQVMAIYMGAQLQCNGVS